MHTYFPQKIWYIQWHIKKSKIYNSCKNRIEGRVGGKKTLSY